MDEHAWQAEVELDGEPVFTATVFAPFLFDEMIKQGQYVDQLERLGSPLRARVTAHDDTHVRIVDAGCNVGLFPLFARTICGPVWVFGFDPLLMNCQAAAANWNGMPHKAFWCALGARAERLPLHLMSSTGCSLMQPEADEWVRETGNPAPGQVDTDVLPLDNFDLGRVDLIKLDVEGAEAQVLEGAVETIRRDRPYVICSYEHPSNDRAALIASLPGYTVRDDEANRLLTFSPAGAPNTSPG